MRWRQHEFQLHLNQPSPTPPSVSGPLGIPPKCNGLVIDICHLGRARNNHSKRSVIKISSHQNTISVLLSKTVVSLRYLYLWSDRKDLNTIDQYIFNKNNNNDIPSVQLTKAVPIRRRRSNSFQFSIHFNNPIPRRRRRVSTNTEPEGSLTPLQLLLDIEICITIQWKAHAATKALLLVSTFAVCHASKV